MDKDTRRWSEASEVIPMFPSLVWKTQIEAGLRDAMNARIVEVLAEMRRDALPLAPGQGWQSAQDLHEREAFRELVSCIDRCTKGILRFLRIGAAECEITGCWATALAPGAAHKLHSHPNNFLSGVYYVRTRGRRHHQFPRSAQTSERHQAAGRRTHGGEHGPGRGPRA
jgi:uncharacterized protein (TIGR02466 family)